ncbi:MAG: signal peptidase I [Acidobacteria bacterium]|nr:signal peptidase I [Acidobacteriota bacterium]
MHKKGLLREYFELVAVTVVFTLYLQTFVVQAFQIPSSSMEQNLLVGDHLLVNKCVFSGFGVGGWAEHILPFEDPKRGDIVVFKYPEDPTKDFVKRVIGLPGDMVEIRNKQILINGKSLEETYKFHTDAHIYPSYEVGMRPELAVRDNFGPVRVPDGHLFVMGDNRDNSLDSRYWGPLPRSYLKGKPLVIYWSYEADKESYMKTDYATRARNLLSTIINFIPRTRWSRFFKIIR